MKNSLFLLLFLSQICHFCFAQVTKESIVAKIDKALTFYESKKDSLKILAEQIKNDAERIGLKREASYYYRLMGFYYEYEGKMDKAANSYLSYLKEAESNGFIEEKYQAIGDIANMYVMTGQNEKAIILFLRGIREGQKDKINPKRLSTFFTNLGVVYRKEAKLDSAFYYYSKALNIKKQLKDSVGIANVNINIAALLIKQKKYVLAKPYVEKNIVFHKKINSEEDLWYDYSSISEIYLNLNQKKEAEWYTNECVRIAKKINSKTKEHLSIGDLSNLNRYFGDYKKAYEYYAIYDSLGKTIINAETNKSIGELREKYESDKKEQENNLLNQQLKQEKLQRVFYLIGLLSLLVFSGVIGFFLVKNRRKNRLIESQNQKLSDLNREKNHLISMVSHDLSTPFLAIKMWNSLLKMNLQDNPKASEASQIIDQSAEQGISLIKNILDVEKAETNRHDLQLEKIDLIAVTRGVIGAIEASAQAKNIKIWFEPSSRKVIILSDKHLIIRVLENLFTNAIKYSNPEKQVWISVEEDSDHIYLKVKDEGVGIDSKDIPKLFAKYGVTASKPTAGESSTGLGLSIVKRILDEIGGDIHCQSELGKGTEFTVRLGKVK